MSTRVLTAIFVILLISVPGGKVTAQSDALMQAFRQSQDLNKLGRHKEAEPFAQRALKLGEQEFGPEHRATATLVNNLALLYNAQGRYADSELLYKRSLKVLENTLGPDHADVATSLNNLAELYNAQGRYADSETLHRRSLAVREKVLGSNHADVAFSLNNLALLYHAQGRYTDAEPLHRRSLAINEIVLGPDHPRLALSLNNLAGLYGDQGRYSDAEPLHKRSLTIREKAFGPNHPLVASSLNNLAYLYKAQGRYADAEPLYKRSLAIREKALGPEHPDVGTGLNNLALLYGNQGRYADAEPLHKRSLTIREKAFGPKHPTVATSLNNLALLYQAQGRYADSEPLQKRSLAIFERSLGPDHPLIATSLSTLATLYYAQGRYADSEPLYKRSLAINEAALGPNHPGLALGLSNLANQYSAQGQFTLALDFIRRSSAIHRDRAQRTGGFSGGRLSEQKSVRYAFVSHVGYATALADKEGSTAAALTAEAFEVGQLAQATSVGAAVAGIGARFAAGDDALAETVRKYQDAIERWQRLDKKRIAAVGRPPTKRNNINEQKLRAQLANVDRQLKELDKRLTHDFPDYAELASPKPTPLEDAQKLLGPSEALLTWLSAGKETYLWVVRRDRAAMKRLDIGSKALTKAVATLRRGLDPSRVETLADVPVFNTTKSFALYQRLFAAAEPMLDGVSHIFAVPDGALQSLPLGVLITDKPQDQPTDFAGYKQVPWLARKYAMTTLPTVSSLRALRRFAKATRANKPFRGFGDPLLEGHPGNNRGTKLASLFKARGVADVNAVRSQLAPLPETADELKSMAAILGASVDNLFLQDQATERNVKTLDLKDYRVVAFATHGLVSGDLNGLAEPALVLTPPKTGTLEDDGLLTASEVAHLKLNTDLVVLSACNTASTDGSTGAEALSGLAKAFFYAGTRALLVSHWPVNSDASVKLTTRMLNEASNHNIGRAEALRRSMVSLMEDTEKSHYAHPLFWAPFVLVGEGGTYKAN